MKEQLHVNWYYDLTTDHRITDDPEGTLCALCPSCVAKHGNNVTFAATGEWGSCTCGDCGATQYDESDVSEDDELVTWES